MPLIVMDEGAVKILQHYVRGQSTAVPYQLRLFRNDFTPVVGSVYADFTQANFDGYAPITLVPGDWQVPTIVGGRAVAEYDVVPQEFTNTGEDTQVIYGYYVVMTGDAVALWAERFADPIPIAPDGTIEVTPKFTMKSEY